MLTVNYFSNNTLRLRELFVNRFMNTLEFLKVIMQWIYFDPLFYTHSFVHKQSSNSSKHTTKKKKKSFQS